MNTNNNVKHILFITSSRIGDAVLSFGLLEHLRKKYPDAQFTIACGPLVSSFFEGFPAPNKVIPLKKKKYSKHWFDLWRQVVGIPFDIVVDLRNSIVSRTIRAKRRYIFGSHIDQTLHKVEQNAQVLGLEDIPSPVLWMSEKQLLRARQLIPEGGAVLGVGPTANWAGKTWPVENFIEIVRWMTAPDGMMPSARVAIFAAPGEEEIARKLLSAIPEGNAVDLIAKTDPALAAACLSLCSYYIGNDSGLMHCAAAANIPTMGLFGPSYPQLYRPWGAKANYVSTPETFDQLIDFPGYNSKTVGCLMQSLTVDTVKEAIKKSW